MAVRRMLVQLIKNNQETQTKGARKFSNHNQLLNNHLIFAWIFKGLSWVTIMQWVALYWTSYGFSGFLPLFKNMQIGRLDMQTLLGMNDCVYMVPWDGLALHTR